MNRNERYYQQIIGAIGYTMLLFLLLHNAFGLLLELLAIFLEQVPNPLASIAHQLFYAAGYLLSFMLPVSLLKRTVKRAGLPYQSMPADLRVSPWIFLMLPAAVTVIFSAAYFNSLMVNIIDYSSFSSDILWGETAQAPAVYTWVLDFILICVLPGFCEEFLFRGAILTNCRPFGRSNAILISAFLFAVMHQNAEQLLYAFIAGIFLGIIYEKTGNIWCCTILHIFNNFISTFESVIFYKLDGLFVSSIALTLFEVALFALGSLSLAVLILRFCSKKPELANGVFEQDFPATDAYATHPIAPKRAFRLFLRTPMVVFLSLALVETLLLILFALGYNYG